MASATGRSRPTIRKALRELEQPVAPLERVRRPGGGREATRERDPALLAELEALVEPDSRGDPMSPLRWTRKSTRQLAGVLTRGGHPVSHRVVAESLHAADYSPQANVKTLEGAAHPERDARFRYLNAPARAGHRNGNVIS